MLTTTAVLARGALEAAPDAMIIIDASGIVRYANRQVSALFGYAHDEIIEQSVGTVSEPACRTSGRLHPHRARTAHGGGPGSAWSATGWQ